MATQIVMDHTGNRDTNSIPKMPTDWLKPKSVSRN